VKPEDHDRKNERLLRSFDRLDRELDSEAVFEYGIIVGMHWLNAALHRRGLTTEAEDLLHSDMPALWFTVPDDLLPGFEAMKEIEVQRNRYVRGPEACPRDAAQWCDDKLAFIKQLSLANP
jgi:hypothetical protein